MNTLEPEKYEILEEKITQIMRRFHISREDVLMSAFDISKDVVAVKIQRELKEREQNEEKGM